MEHNECKRLLQAFIGDNVELDLWSKDEIKQLAAYINESTNGTLSEGNVSSEIQYNPNGSYASIEGITSPDGRVLGKMGHSERIGAGLYKNVPGEFDMEMFKAAVAYFK